MMNAFVRQLAALSALWALCELIAPTGAQQRMVRFAVSLLVMVALVSALSGLLGHGEIGALPAASVLTDGAQSDGLRRIAVQSAANQAWRYCQALARRAGYQARGQVLLRENGALEQVRMTLSTLPEQKPLMGWAELQSRLAGALETDPSQVLVAMETNKAEPAADGVLEAGGP